MDFMNFAASLLLYFESEIRIRMGTSLLLGMCYTIIVICYLVIVQLIVKIADCRFVESLRSVFSL